MSEQLELPGAGPGPTDDCVVTPGRLAKILASILDDRDLVMDVMTLDGTTEEVDIGCLLAGVGEGWGEIATIYLALQGPNGTTHWQMTVRPNG